MWSVTLDPRDCDSEAQGSGHLMTCWLFTSVLISGKLLCKYRPVMGDGNYSHSKAFVRFAFCSQLFTNFSKNVVKWLNLFPSSPALSEDYFQVLC